MSDFDRDDPPSCAFCGASLGIQYGPGVRCCWTCAHAPREAVEYVDPDPRWSAESDLRYPPLTEKEKEEAHEKRADERAGRGTGEGTGSDQAA